jgi:lysine-N-methylase
MSLPLRNLPVLQNWDCHTCGTCCKEYVVTLSNEERRKIEAQNWDGDPVVGNRPLFKKSGPWWKRRYALNHRSDGSCVFLSDAGRCRIHEKLGYEAKPLPCRLFPFVLIPAGDHWRVGMRFACPSAADNKGRHVKEHEPLLRKFTDELARREGLDARAEERANAPPKLQSRQRIEWSDLNRINLAVLSVLQNQEDRLERRIRKCLAFVELCRQAHFDQLSGKRLNEFLRILATAIDAEVPTDARAVPGPNWIGRILFRQAVAIFTRKDHGPERGIAHKGRLALLNAAWRFALGKGAVPRLHRRIPETTFEKIEDTTLDLVPEAEEILERYYTVKVESLQFFGPPNFRVPYWEGLEMLVATFPILLWVARALGGKPTESLSRALTIVDDHFGYNRVLGSRRQRLGFRLLARSGELKKLIAWYGRQSAVAGTADPASGPQTEISVPR